MYEAFSGSTCEYEALREGSSAAFRVQRAAHDYGEGGDSDSGEEEESRAQGGGLLVSRFRVRLSMSLLSLEVLPLLVDY